MGIWKYAILLIEKWWSYTKRKEKEKKRGKLHQFWRDKSYQNLSSLYVGRQQVIIYLILKGRAGGQCFGLGINETTAPSTFMLMQMPHAHGFLPKDKFGWAILNFHASSSPIKDIFILHDWVQFISSLSLSSIQFPFPFISIMTQHKKKKASFLSLTDWNHLSMILVCYI